MGEYREDKLTPVTIRGMDAALTAAYPAMGRESRDILLAHIWGETGGKSCHNYNVGNCKWTDGYRSDWTAFPCGEEVPEEQAEEEARYHPDLVEVRSRYLRGAARMASIWLKPPHPWTRFRAFGSLAEGLRDHVQLISGKARYAKAWTALCGGDVDDYSAELGRAGYYTADPGAYARLLRGTLAQVRKELAGHPTLSKGDRGEDVARWQRIVGAAPDGTFGPRTEALTKDWQKAHGLTPDGIVGPITWRAAP